MSIPNIKEVADTAVLMRDLHDKATEIAGGYPEDVRGFMQHTLLDGFLIETTHEPDSPYRGYRYPSYQALVLDIGDRPRRAPLHCPPEIQWREPRDCYRNCYRVILNDAEGSFERYTYVEGFAQTNLLIVRHAWLVDNNDGTIVDPTWAGFVNHPGHGIEPGFKATYWGVRFSTDYLFRRINETEYTSVFDADWRVNFRCLKVGLVTDDDGVVIADGEA